MRVFKLPPMIPSKPKSAAVLYWICLVKWGGGLSLETTVAVGHSLVDGKEISTLTKAVGRDIRRLKSTGQLWNLFSLVLGEGNKKEDCLEFLYVLQRQDDQTGLK